MQVLRAPHDYGPDVSVQVKAPAYAHANQWLPPVGKPRWRHCHRCLVGEYSTSETCWQCDLPACVIAVELTYTQRHRAQHR